MNRRDFLKNTVSGIALATMPLNIKGVNVENISIKSAKIREITAYDISSDEIITRMDIATKTKRWNIHTVTTAYWRDKEKMKDQRKIMHGELYRIMKENNITMSDLITLEMPKGITLVAA